MATNQLGGDVLDPTATNHLGSDEQPLTSSEVHHDLGLPEEYRRRILASEAALNEAAVLRGGRVELATGSFLRLLPLHYLPRVQMKRFFEEYLGRPDREAEGKGYAKKNWLEIPPEEVQGSFEELWRMGSLRDERERDRYEEICRKVSPEEAKLQKLITEYMTSKDESVRKLEKDLAKVMEKVPTLGGLELIHQCIKVAELKEEFENNLKEVGGGEKEAGKTSISAAIDGGGGASSSSYGQNGMPDNQLNSNGAGGAASSYVFPKEGIISDNQLMGNGISFPSAAAACPYGEGPEPILEVVIDVQKGEAEKSLSESPPSSKGCFKGYFSREADYPPGVDSLLFQELKLIAISGAGIVAFSQYIGGGGVDFEELKPLLFKLLAFGFTSYVVGTFTKTQVPEIAVAAMTGSLFLLVASFVIVSLHFGGGGGASWVLCAMYAIMIISLLRKLSEIFTKGVRKPAEASKL